MEIVGKINNKINKFFYYLFHYIFYKCRFKYLGRRVYIQNPLKLDGCHNMVIEDNVVIQYKTWLAALPLTGGACILKIGKNTVLGHFNHIYSTREIIIEENVLTADKVYISDNLHSYQDISVPIKDQPIWQNNTVKIGAGSWLGENVCVLGAKIGKHCIIGANSVVTKDIPDYTVAVGIPARVIKKYNLISKEWERV